MNDPKRNAADETQARSYHHGNLKASLIEAGLAALADTDVAGISLRQLAKEVGVSANAAYRHFAGKEALLDAIAAEGFRRFALAQQASVVQALTPEDQLKASGAAYVAFAQAQPALYRLMFQRLSHAAHDAHLAHHATEALSVLMGATSNLVGAPASDERVRVAAAAAWSLVHGLSALSQGGQLAVFGLPMQILVDKVLSMPHAVPGLPAAPPPIA